MNLKLLEKYNLVFDRLQKNNFSGNDVSDVSASQFFIKANEIKKIPILGKKLFFPIHFIKDHFGSSLVKVFHLESKNQYAQAHSIIIRSLLELESIKKDKSYLSEALKLEREMFSMRNMAYKNYCWGQPYNWPSKELMVKNTPRTTVSSQVAASYLDLYEITKEAKFLDIAISIGNFFIEDLNFTPDTSGDLCFSYTTKDNYHIHNASMLASAVLFRLYYYTNLEKFKEYGLKSMNFTIKHQNEDGSWYYWAKPDKINGVIDNYHTGFVLESLITIKKYWDGEFIYENQLEKGMHFFINNFFSQNAEPKMRHDKLYPIDIQSCAQSIITILEYKSLCNFETDLDQKILNWTLENLFEFDRFYYRKYSNSKIDKNSYIRWGDSWMLRAMAMSIKYYE